MIKGRALCCSRRGGGRFPVLRIVNWWHGGFFNTSICILTPRNNSEEQLRDGRWVQKSAKQGCYHHADYSFLRRCSDVSDTSPNICQTAFFSLQGTKRKEKKMTVSIGPLFTLIIQSLATGVSTLGHIIMTVITLKKPNLWSFRERCVNFWW